MTDNSNNMVDASGLTITFFIRDASGVDTDTNDADTNDADTNDADTNYADTNDASVFSSNIDNCNDPTSVMNIILGFLEPDKYDKFSLGKRYRSCVDCDMSKNKIRPDKKLKSGKVNKSIDQITLRTTKDAVKRPYRDSPRRDSPRRGKPYRNQPWILGPSSNEEVIVRNKVNISEKVGSLSDLIKLITNNPLADNIEYNINMTALHSIKHDLLNLDAMIGMHALKNHVVDQIIYYLQGFNKMGGSGDFMHTVIYGPPGSGKTEVAKIIGIIFMKLGVLSKNKFVKATRADLIAGYLGQTAIKTMDVVKNAVGGVLFIDEAYALGNSEKRDSFAKECIDTLCEALSEHKDDLMVIIAGYEKELNDSFFSYNPGLNSRFTWRFKTDDYKPAELMEIFRKKVNDAGWSVEQDALTEGWFKSNIDYFKYFGRDMETLFAKVKIAHSRRVFCLPKDEKTKITTLDLDNGLILYLENDEVKSRKSSDLIYSMYL